MFPFWFFPSQMSQFSVLDKCVFLHLVQLDGEEEVRMKVREDALAKVFQTAASVCVNKGLMAAERAARFSRSGEICDCVGSFLAD